MDQDYHDPVTGYCSSRRERLSVLALYSKPQEHPDDFHEQSAIAPRNSSRSATESLKRYGRLKETREGSGGPEPELREQSGMTDRTRSPGTQVV